MDDDHPMFVRRALSQSHKAIWDEGELRAPQTILSDRSRRVVNAHVHDRIGLAGHKVAFLYRNPKDTHLSAVRFSLVDFDWNPGAQEPDESAVMKLIRSENIMATSIARCLAFRGWLEKADISIRFEDLTDPKTKTAEKVARAVGVKPKPITDVLGDKAPWVTDEYRGTWSGKHSDHRDVWNDALEAQWKRLGGHIVDKAYGYR